MMEKWIGKEENTSGSYYATKFEELKLRHGGMFNSNKLYRFESRFGEEYNITDVDVIDVIEKLLEEGDAKKMYNYLYGLVIEKFGAIDFILDIGHKIAQEREKGYHEGKRHMQREMRKMLGL